MVLLCMGQRSDAKGNSPAYSLNITLGNRTESSHLHARRLYAAPAGAESGFSFAFHHLRRSGATAGASAQSYRSSIRTVYRVSRPRSNTPNHGFGVPGIPSPAGYLTVSLYKLPGRDSYAGGRSSSPSPAAATAAAGRNPSVTMNACASNELPVDVDHRRPGGGGSAPKRGRGGRLPPERMDSSASLLLLQVPRVMPPHEELTLEAREGRVDEDGTVAAWWEGDGKREGG